MGQPGSPWPPFFEAMFQWDPEARALHERLVELNRPADREFCACSRFPRLGSEPPRCPPPRLRSACGGGIMALVRPRCEGARLNTKVRDAFGEFRRDAEQLFGQLKAAIFVLESSNDRRFQNIESRLDELEKRPPAA